MNKSAHLNLAPPRVMLRRQNVTIFGRIQVMKNADVGQIVILDLRIDSTPPTAMNEEEEMCKCIVHVLQTGAVARPCRPLYRP